jgi:hypothetical protein
MLMYEGKSAYSYRRLRRNGRNVRAQVDVRLFSPDNGPLVTDIHEMGAGPLSGACTHIHYNIYSTTHPV